MLSIGSTGPDKKWTNLLLSEATLNLVTISITLGVLVFAIGLLAADSDIRRDQRVFIVLFLGLYLAIKLEKLYIMLEGYTVAPHLLGLTYPIKLCLAPAVYFYARSLASSQPVWPGRGDWPALMAPLAAALVATPFYILPGAEKMALFTPEAVNTEQYALAILGCQIGLALFVATALGYLRSTHSLIKQHRERLLDLFSRIEDKTADWLRRIILVLAVGWTLDAVLEGFAFAGIRPPYLYSVSLLLELAWISFIAFNAIRQRSIRGLKSIAAHGQPDAGKRETRSGLSAERMRGIASKLDEVMSKRQLFLDPELSLRDLSDATGASEHHLSETFSQFHTQNFFDYINGLRIDRACDMLKDPDRNILDVAFEVGFNSRSTFNSAFKKHVGQTPSQFRRQQN